MKITVHYRSLYIREISQVTAWNRRGLSGGPTGPQGPWSAWQGTMPVRNSLAIYPVRLLVL